MEVKNPLVFLNKKDSSLTKTFITNLFIGLVAFALFSGVASIASAQEDMEEASSTPAENREIELENLQEQRQAKQAEMEAKREEQKENLDARREAMASQTDAVREQIQERKAVLSERIKNRILALAENISRKMEAAISRLTQIITRFEARVTTLEERGVDGSATTVKLNEAKRHLTVASDIINNQTDDLVDATVGSDNPREAWQAAKAKYKEARDAIGSAHQSLREALSLLKEAVVEAELGRGVSEAVRENDTTEEETTPTE